MLHTAFSSLSLRSVEAFTSSPPPRQPGLEGAQRGVRYGRYGDGPDESSAAREARVRLDRMNTSVRAAFMATAVGPPRVLHLPAPMVGGYVCNLSPAFDS